jgi:hypothetical protein
MLLEGGGTFEKEDIVGGPQVSKRMCSREIVRPGLLPFLLAGYEVSKLLYYRLPTIATGIPTTAESSVHLVLDWNLQKHEPK